MRALWKRGGVVSLKLEENLYSLAQMMESPLLACFDVFRPTDTWQGIDLNEAKMLFCVEIGNVVLQRLGVRRVPPKEVKPYLGGCPRYMIRAKDNAEGYRLRGEYVWKGGGLVDCGERGEESAFEAPIVIEDLNVREHRDLILKYEIMGNCGDYYVKRRLLDLHRYGKHYEWEKHLIFPELYDFTPMTPMYVHENKLDVGEPPPGWFETPD